MTGLDLTSDNPPLSEPTKAVPASVLDQEIGAYIEASLAANTRKAYQTDWAHFISWGGTPPTSPEILARYLADHATTLTVATLARRLVSIGKAHTMQGYSNPASAELVKLTMRGIRRTHGKPQRQVAAAIKEDILAMVATLGADPKSLRDRALILIGFAGAFRRSELVGIMRVDIERVVHGIVITLPRSKTDQDGIGRKVGIPYGRGLVCPVKALDAWLKSSDVKDGPVFRPVDRHGRFGSSALSSEAVAIVVKELAKAVGLDAERYSGHSLRAGLATSAANAGVPVWKIKAQTGHASDAMLSRYIRDGELFQQNAAGFLL